MSVTVHAELSTIPGVKAAIAAGESLFLAGSREALSQLPRGNWVGGTICYFMTEEGCLQAEDRIFVTKVPEFALEVRALDYGPDNLAQLHRDAPDNGFTFVVLPAASEVLKTFAEQAANFDGFLLHPIVGWVSGVRVDRIGLDMPAVFNGKSGAVLEDRCVALHISLPIGKMAELEIVNIFESGGGDVIRFEKAGFHASQCLVNGKPANLAEYITCKGIPTEFPLVGDYNGSSINVSFQAVDAAKGTVELYAPVFAGVDYHFAKPVADYSDAFAKAATGEEPEPAFACNCILNYLYGKLEGKKAGHLTGPITFGEIAHQLLNQTLVRLQILDIG
jgi:hypothetical protein